MTLSWVGCAVAPEGLRLNSVVALPEGGFAATSTSTGDVWERSTDAGWRGEKLTRLSRGRTPRQRDVVPVGFRPDNLRFVDGGANHPRRVLSGGSRRPQRMAELKTRKNDADVEAFLDGIENEKRRDDCRAVVELMAHVTGERPAMWGDSIVGFGSYHYRYPTGREGDWMATGVAPRKQSLTVYIMTGFERHAALMEKLGRFTTGRSCLYIKRLEDVDINVLRDLVRDSYARVSQGHYGW